MEALVLAMARPRELARREDAQGLADVQSLVVRQVADAVRVPAAEQVKQQHPAPALDQPVSDVRQGHCVV